MKFAHSHSEELANPAMPPPNVDRSKWASPNARDWARQSGFRAAATAIGWAYDAYIIVPDNAQWIIDGIDNDDPRVLGFLPNITEEDIEELANCAADNELKFTPDVLNTYRSAYYGALRLAAELVINEELWEE